MADEKDPLSGSMVLSNYIFELLEVNAGVAGFLLQLHPENVDAVVESVTAHAEKGAGTKRTLYVGQEEEEEVEDEVEEVVEVGAGRGKEEGHCLFFLMPWMSTGGRAFQRLRPLV